MNRFKAHPTPNPDSLKVTTTAGPFTDRPLETYSSAPEAVDRPLALALLQIEGVANVFMVPDFLTVTKSREASWDTVWPQVSGALVRHAGD